jgi:EAL domain-containing protein (putative c-di-GMP-specific phosphodiesterase class I)
MWWTITRGQTWRGELVNRRADGSLFVAETSIVPVRDRHGMNVAYVGVQRDVSPMRELRSSLDNTRKQRERLAGALERIVLKDSIDETCADLAAVVAEIPGVMACGIGLAEDEGGVRLAAALPGGLHESLEIPPAAAERACRPDTGPWIETVAGMPDGVRAAALAGAGVGAILYLPVRQEGATLAVLVAGGADRQGADAWAQLLALGEVAAVLRAVIGPSASPLQLRRRRRAWIGRLIDEDAFRPVFQPIKDMVTGRVAGFEALTRFADDTSPGTVFAEAEACGLGQPLELATLAASIRASAELPRGTWLGLNVSSGLLHRGAEVRELVRSARREIVVEITHEGTPDYVAAREVVEHLAPDIRIAVDDIVGGAADFRHLVDLRPDFVKLGRDLVRGIEHDVGRQAVVAGLKQYSQATGGGLIAEGVETSEEHAMLVKLGVPFGQGYHLGRPAPASEWRAAGVAAAAARH